MLFSYTHTVIFTFHYDYVFTGYFLCFRVYNPGSKKNSENMPFFAAKSLISKEKNCSRQTENSRECSRNHPKISRPRC